MLSYQHELACLCFLNCLKVCPDVALAHALVALCHSPNYNFKGEAYYLSANHPEDAQLADWHCMFPSQQVAERHATLGIQKMEELKKQYRKAKKKNKKASVPNSMISDTESQFLNAVRILCGSPGIDPGLANDILGIPYSEALRKLYKKYPRDPEIAYFFAEALMVLNAWKLYEYPSGRALSPDVHETRTVLEGALALHPHHAGLCHMYVHLSEMAPKPEQALDYARPLRTEFRHAGHLIHMPTHLDVLCGDYTSVIHYNCQAIAADTHLSRLSPETAGRESFYEGYSVHNYHMAVYGAILGGMEAKGMEVAASLNKILTEDLFRECPSIVAYLEAYSALEVHVMVRFGRWKELLELELPKDKTLMLYRTASIRYGRALAFAMQGQLLLAQKEADRFDSLRKSHADADIRILHNNTVAELLELDATMMRGEIAYREGRHKAGLALLRKAVELQDNLNYDEPWGKMQPIRHALGGLLLEQGQVEEATVVFRKDLVFHPKNPWALVGLIKCLESQNQCCEVKQLQETLRQQRQSEWADFEIVVACECCQHPA